MDRRIATIVAHMEASLERPPSVPELAALVRLSPSRFAHLFRDEIGVSPGKYLQRLRMERARELLERTAVSVRSVMQRVGFRDPSHFARDFRRHHGVPPSALRAARPRLPATPTAGAARESAQPAAPGSDDTGDEDDPAGYNGPKAG